MLEPIALKGARWVLRRGGGGNASSLSDVRHEVAWIADVQKIHPCVLPQVPYQSVRQRQRWGAKPLGQCSRIQ